MIRDWLVDCARWRAHRHVVWAHRWMDFSQWLTALPWRRITERKTHGTQEEGRRAADPRTGG